MTPSVSVVIPLYNKGRYIAAAIDSVLAQTVRDFELIIVNDGSKASGPEIVNNYDDQRIHLINQKNQGVSVARNCGISVAKAEIVAFLDADDAWYSDFLETILKLRQDYPAAGMYGTGYEVYSEGKLVRNIVHTPELGDRLFLSYFKEYLSAGHPIIITSGFAAPKRVLQDVGGYSELLRVGEDHELYGKIALRYPVAYSSRICSKYNIGTENNADAVDFLLEVPLEGYLTRVSDDSLSIYAKDLNNYLDSWTIRTGGRNIYSGYRRMGRKQVTSVKSLKYQMLIIAFLLISCVPFSLSVIPPTKVRKVLRLVNMSL
jgi:glycosyltransferase involved in cell wall biosynthesis